MKSIKLSHDTKNVLKDMNGTYDESIHSLINEVGDYMPLVDYNDSSMTVIKISESTYDMINSFRISHGESIENILIRMMIIRQILNSNTE